MDRKVSDCFTTVQGHLLLAVIIIFSLSTTVMGGALNLADNALEVLSGVEPNIMVLSDDSGSMDWGVMTTENEGTFLLGPWSYYYAHPNPGASGTTSPSANISFYVVPSEEKLVSAGVPAPQGGVWRAWNAQYNRVYYNPEITYIPWSGVDTTGTGYTNVSPSKAYYNPFVPSEGSLNLTTTTTYDTDCGLLADCTTAGLTGLFSVSDFYPARYYIWIDADNDSVVDEDDKHTLVEIRNSGCTAGAKCPSTFVRPIHDENIGSGRSDCSTNNGDGTVTCNYNEEIQNFANWFSYYRKRELTAKAALSNVVEKNTTARIGYATILNNASNALQVASMNASSASGNKKSLLDKIFSTYTTGPINSTPLRVNLDAVGRYFECRSGDIFGSSADSTPGSVGCPVLASPGGSCQGNYTVLITDGFYNQAVPATFVGNTDGSSNTNYDGGAFADTYSDTLADVAMSYYERDLHST
ncbi:MAG: hypothetical protein ABFS45_13065, partial [Pseudomonadota bacterium]